MEVNMKKFLASMAFLGGFFLTPTIYAQSGFFLEPMVTYQNLKYKSTELEQLGPFNNINAQDSIELTESGLVASVSFPISF